VSLQFEWDEQKANSNYRKHRVSFEEAQTVFNDPQSITILDSAHSIEEERFIDIGLSNQGRVLVVAYTEREDRIRIISSRTATTREIQIYEQG
jgi:uncharacterized protein